MPEFRKVRGVIQNLNRVSERVITKIGLDITANLIETTPVKTGWARANWLPSIGSPSFGNGDISDVSGAASSQASAQAGIAAGNYKLSQGPLHIANGASYIELLNSGSSTQAPSGFVQRAIQKAVIRDIKVTNI